MSLRKRGKMKCTEHLCGKFFTKIDGLKLHLKAVHNKKTYDDYKCSISGCNEVFTRSDNFYRHLLRKNHFFSGELTL